MTRKLATMFLLMPFAAMATTWYVNGSSGSDYNSGTSQSSAKATIQAAIDASSAGDTILVAPGTYAPIESYNKAIAIKSTSGAAATIIDGGGESMVARLSASFDSEEPSTFATVLDGFTLQHGYGDSIGEAAAAFGGMLENCIIRDNTGGGYGGASGCIVSKLYNSLVCNNVFRSSSAYGYVGTALYPYFGGGALANCHMVANCTVVDNEGYGFWDGGTAVNCIAYGNTCDVYLSSGRTIGEVFSNTFIGTAQIGTNTSPSTSVNGNISGAPLLTGDYRLATGSPCIDAGDNSYVTGDMDLAGNARISNGTVDIGCYEYGGASAHRYEVVLSSGITWTDARNAAIARGGHLATITSAAEWAELESQCELDNFLWLGGTDKDSEGNWTWVTGEAWSYSRWSATQPDNYNSQHYLLQLRGDWDDEADSAYAYTMAGYVVEYGDGLSDTLTGASPTPPPVLNDGLVAYWPFDGNANDASGNGRDLTAVKNDPQLTTDRFGKANGAYVFNGSLAQNIEQYAEDRDEQPEDRDEQRAQSIIGSFSFGFWFQTNSSYLDYGAGSVLWNPGNYAVYPMHGGVYNDERGEASGLGVKVGVDGIEIVEHATCYMPTKLTYQADIGSGWHHVVVTVEDSGCPLLYLDGTYVATGETSDRTRLFRPIIGGSDWGYYTGKVDDLVVYNRALSAAEVKALYDGASPTPPPVLNDGLVAYWPFDGNANDASGNENNGVVHGATLTTDRFGNANGAYRFGTGNYIQVSDSGSLNSITKAMTISAWVRPDSWDYWLPIVCKGIFVRQYGLILSNPGGETEIGDCFHANFEYLPPVGEWSHVLVTFDGRSICAYLNGEIVGVVEDSRRFEDGNSDLFIGCDPPSVGLDAAEYIDGMLDDIRIYNRALSAAEVKALYDGASPTPPPVLNDGLVAYWPFDGNANDASGNGNHGTTHGVTLTTDRFGNANGAYYFGDGNYISVPDSVSLDSPSDQITMAVWAKVDEWYWSGSDPWAAILNKGDSQYSFNLWGQAGVASTEIGYYLHAKFDVVPTFGTWNHLTVTYADGCAYAYLNGSLVGTHECDGNFASNSSELQIGRHYPGATEYLYGALDDLRLYNRALSAAEVKALYDGTAVAPTPSANGLWTVTQYDSNSDVRSLADAEAVVADSSLWAKCPVTKTYDRLAFAGNNWSFSQNFSSVQFPGTTEGENSECFVVVADGQIQIPESGYWTFACGSDDGFRVSVSGADFHDEFSTSGEISYSTYCRTMYFPSAGTYAVHVLYYESYGDDLFDLSIAKGSYSYFDSSAFKLVGDPASGVTLVGGTTPSPIPVEVALTSSSFGGDANWYQESAGVWRSGDISDYQSTYMEATVSDATQVSFRWKVSSESGYDYLRFYIDGNEQNSISGEQGWTQKTYTLSSGTHTLKWSYTKDGSVSGGSDCGWVEEIRATRAYTGPICTVTFDANGGDVYPGTRSVSEGAAIGSLPTPTREGYEFLGWHRGKEASSADVTASTVVTGDLIVYAVWQIADYDIYLDANGGYVGTSSISRNWGAALGTLPTPTRTGYTFLGWYDEYGWQVDERTEVYGDATYYANWEQLSYSVTFDANGGSGGNVYTYYYGDNLGSLPTPTREGYEFLGWFTAKTDGSQADCWTEVYDNAIYYAQWRILSYTVTFDANGGAVGTSSVTRNHGASLGSLPVPSRTGHTFLGWYTSASGGSRVYETDAVTSSRTLYAHWQANTYTVTFNANGGDSSCSYSRTYGSSVGTLSTASRSGYVFKGWFTAASGGTQVSSSATVTGNATYYAHWATYAEEIAAALGTANVEFSTDTLAPWVPDGSSVCSGYVYHNGSSTMSVRLYGSGLLSFRWKVSSEPEYDTLTYSVDGIQGGRISGEQGWSSASILVAGAGWHTVRFTYAKDGGSTYGSDCGWVDSLAWTGSAPPVTNFTITFNANGGTVGTASVTRSQGAQLGTLPIPARTGYTFLGWFTSASGGVQVYASTMVSANATYYAHWQANGSGGGSGGGTTPPVVNYTITFDGNGGSVDTLRVTRASGAAIGSMPVPEAEGYEFLGWFTARTGGVQVSTTDRVTANATYYAHWRVVEDPNTLWDEDEAFDADAAAVFDGFLTKNDEACGVLQVKVGKANKRTGVAKLTAKVSLLGQPSKLSYKGVFGTPGAGDDFTPGVATLTCNGHPDLALRIGRNALWGELDDYEVEGARNVFAKAGDPLAAALSRWQGAYTLVLETVEAEGAGAANAWGYSGLTLTVGAKGKVKIQGTMVDGAKVNVASQLLVGENRCCIPVVAPLYAKKGGFGFNLWLQDDGSLEVGELGAWDATDSKTPFSAWFGENIPAARAGAALPASLSFMFLGEPDIDGVEVLYDFLPWEVPVTTGSSWTLPAAGSVKYDRDVEDYIDVKESSNPAGLKLTYVSKTGAFKGSFKMYAVDDGGRLKKYTVKVSGVMVDGVGYGTASAKNAGSWPVSIQ